MWLPGSTSLQAAIRREDLSPVNGGNGETTEGNGSKQKKLTPRQQIDKLKAACNRALQQVMQKRIYAAGMGDMDKEGKRELYMSANAKLNHITDITGVSGVNAPECGVEKLQERLDIIIGWNNGTRDDFIL